MTLPASMTAMVLDMPGQALRAATLPVPVPSGRDVLVRVTACAVCRTDLHIVDGDLSPHVLPLVPGHEIVGQVAAAGDGARRFHPGQRVGIPWLAGSCGVCAFCLGGRENLCDRAVFTGYDRHGGCAEYTLADERFCFALPDICDDAHAAPLMCAGLIGYRAYAMTGEAHRLGLYGFGAAAHLIAQLALRQGREVLAFTRPGDAASQAFARSLGAAWAGPADMSDIPSFPYALLWGERCVRSVANLTRLDGERFLAEVAHGEVTTVIHCYPLEAANQALADLRAGRVDGAAVLVVGRTG